VNPRDVVMTMSDAMMDDVSYEATPDAVWGTFTGTERPRMITHLTDQKSRILANWAVSVATLPAFRAMPDLPLGHIQRNMPVVLDGAIDAIATSSGTSDPAVLERAVELAAGHGRSRLNDQFDLADVLTEFHLLRQEVWATLWRSAEGEPDALETLRTVGERVARTFDQLTVAAAEAWAAASANEARS
jgi:hypothetical protein